MHTSKISEPQSITFEMVKRWAGWIPAKMTLLVSISVLGLLGLVSFYLKPLTNNQLRLITFLYLVIVGIVSKLVGKWGSEQRKYHIPMLKDYIKNHLRSLALYQSYKDAEKYKPQIKWHQKNIEKAKDFLCKVTLGIDRPHDYEEAKRLALIDLQEPTRMATIDWIPVGDKDWTVPEIIAALENDTDEAKIIIKNFMGTLDDFLLR